jgi:hypothetical protein
MTKAKKRKPSKIDQLIDAVKNQTPPKTEQPPKESLEITCSDEFQSIVSESRSIRTLEDALAAANVDLAIWEVDHYTINKWDGFNKNVKKKLKYVEGKATGTIDHSPYPVVVPLWQVKVRLRRKVEKRVQDGIEMLMERMSKHSPRYRAYPKIKGVSNPHLLEVAVFDAHFAKLAWGAETGTDQDLKIIQDIFHDAVIELVSKSKGFPIEKVLFPLGQDFFHIDNPNNTTVNGTPLDVDSRYPKIFDAGVLACVKAIDYLAAIAPVDVLWVPGNHDRTTSYHLAYVLKVFYRLNSRVNVDISPSPRKYYTYGKCLLGYTHGDEEKRSSLPTIMASEKPREFGNAICREWHIGHTHTEKRFEFNAENTIGNVTIRVLPSISGTDAWHHRKGYVGGNRAAVAYLWSKDQGYSGHFLASVKDAKAHS